MAKKKIGLLVGSDIVAHHEMVASVDSLVKRHFEPVLFYPQHRTPQNPNAQQQIFKDYGFVENKILRAIFAYKDQRDPTNGISLPTPAQIADRYNLQAPQAVEDVNDPAFYESLASDPDYFGTISERCTQLFGPAATAALTSESPIHGRRFLINVHTGALPFYRGLYSTPRAMFDAISNPERAANERGWGKYGYTIHHIEAFRPVKGDQMGRYNGIDTGHIIDIDHGPVDPSKTVYATNIQIAQMAADGLSTLINKIANGSPIDGYPQQAPDERNYFSLASARTLQQWSDAGLRLFDRDEVHRILTETFSDSKTKKEIGDFIDGLLSAYFDRREHSIDTPMPSNDLGSPDSKGSFGRAHSGPKGGKKKNTPPAAAADRRRGERRSGLVVS